MTMIDRTVSCGMMAVVMTCVCCYAAFVVGDVRSDRSDSPTATQSEHSFCFKL